MRAVLALPAPPGPGGLLSAGAQAQQPAAPERGSLSRLVLLARRGLSYYRSPYSSARYRRAFDGVERYCMFLGYPRSGHSLVGSLFNAHPEMVIAHECDALHYLRLGVGRNELYALLLERDQWFARGGQQWNGYEYKVPGQWQGRFERLRVIGDKRGGGSTWWLRHEPALLDRLRRTVSVPLRLVHIVRNPFDNIATFARFRSVSLEQAADRYFMLAETNQDLRSRLGEEELFEAHLDDLVADPRRLLREMCAFLALAAPPDYLEACAALVFESPKRTRRSAEWSPQLLASVAERVKAVPFLARYSFEA